MGGCHFARPVLLLGTLDIKNAFNSLRRSDVLNALKYNFLVPHYILATIRYLSYRQLVYYKSLGRRVQHITSGAAQEFFLGTLKILREDMPEETFFVGNSDDIAAVITTRNTEEA